MAYKVFISTGKKGSKKKKNKKKVDPVNKWVKKETDITRFI